MIVHHHRWQHVPHTVDFLMVFDKKKKRTSNTNERFDDLQLFRVQVGRSRCNPTGGFALFTAPFSPIARTLAPNNNDISSVGICEVSSLYLQATQVTRSVSRPHRECTRKKQSTTTSRCGKMTFVWRSKFDVAPGPTTVCPTQACCSLHPFVLHQRPRNSTPALLRVLGHHLFRLSLSVPR